MQLSQANSIVRRITVNCLSKSETRSDEVTTHQKNDKKKIWKTIRFVVLLAQQYAYETAHTSTTTTTKTTVNEYYSKEQQQQQHHNKTSVSRCREMTAAAVLPLRLSFLVSYAFVWHLHIWTHAAHCTPFVMRGNTHTHTLLTVLERTHTHLRVSYFSLRRLLAVSDTVFCRPCAV